MRSHLRLFNKDESGCGDGIGFALEKTTLPAVWRLNWRASSVDAGDQGWGLLQSSKMGQVHC